MAARRESRERALQMLFLWDQTRQSPENVMAGYWNGLLDADLPSDERPAPKPSDPFANDLLCGAVSRVAESDRLIVAHAQNWRLERMSAVDRNILRLAVYELLDNQAPVPVIIDEALEIARRFSGEESVPFINGVLDAVRKELA